MVSVFCPMAPVQTILTGQREALGSPAHIGNSSKITQSMCGQYENRKTTKRLCCLSIILVILILSAIIGSKCKEREDCNGLVFISWIDIGIL